MVRPQGSLKTGFDTDARALASLEYASAKVPKREAPMAYLMQGDVRVDDQELPRG